MFMPISTAMHMIRLLRQNVSEISGDFARPPRLSPPQEDDGGQVAMTRECFALSLQGA